MKTTFILTSAILAFASGMIAAPSKPVKLYVLSGQSNMTGRGAMGDLRKPAAEQKATLVRYIMASGNLEKYKFRYNGRRASACRSVFPATARLEAQWL